MDSPLRRVVDGYNSQLAQSAHTNRVFSRPLSMLRWSARGSPDVRRKPVSGTVTLNEKALLVW